MIVEKPDGESINRIKDQTAERLLYYLGCS